MKNRFGHNGHRGQIGHSVRNGQCGHSGHNGRNGHIVQVFLTSGGRCPQKTNSIYLYIHILLLIINTYGQQLDRGRTSGHHPIFTVHLSRGPRECCPKTVHIQ